MSKETIVKIKKRTNPYTMIDSSIFLNNNISWKAKGLMGYFMSRPDDWKIHLKDLYKQATDGYDSVKSGLKELKLNGYLELVPIREKGKIVAWEYVVYEVPISTKLGITEDSPEEGFPPEAKPLVENPEDEPREGNPLEEKPLVEKPLEANPRYTNNDITNELTNNDKYKYDERQDLFKYNNIIAKSRLVLFEDKVAQTIEEAVKSLYFDEEFSKRNLGLPMELVRNTLEKINPLIIENAIFKIKKTIASGTTISSTKHYLMSCIFNSITEYSSRELAESALTYQEIYKPQKTIFDLVKGTDLEEPVNLLSSSFSEIIFNSFFKEKITKISHENNTLTIVVNDVFIAETLSEKFLEKIKECFKQVGIEDVIIISE